jgi:hypothetical protein
MHVPGHPLNVEAGNSPVVDNSGSFRDFTETLSPLLYGSLEDASADVFVMSRDDSSGNFTAFNAPGGVGDWIISSLITGVARPSQPAQPSLDHSERKGSVVLGIAGLDVSLVDAR